MVRELNIVIIDTSQEETDLLVHQMTREGLKVQYERVDNERQMRAILGREKWDLILCDYAIPGFGALAAMKVLKEMGLKMPFIVIANDDSEETVLSVLNSGAQDFIKKGNYSRLVPAIIRETEIYTKLAKATDEAKKQKQLGYTMIMQNPMPLIIFTTKMDIKLANEAFLTLCGWSEERLQKMNMKEFKVLEKSGHGIREAVETKKGVIGEVVVEFPTGVKYLEQNIVPLLDLSGEIVSMMATYQDNTEKHKIDLAKKELKDFTDAYVSSLSSNLGMLATGNLGFNLTIATPTDNTREAYANFSGINNNLADVQSALTNMIADANMLAKAAVEGKLKTRADTTRHLGDYRKIVEGFNATLDAVMGPLNEAMRMATEFAKCNFATRVDENLHMEGDFLKFKESLNNTGIEVSKAVDLINRQIMDLASSAEEANASIEEVASGAEHIALNAQGVSTNAERGNEGISQVLRAMEDLNQTVTEVAQKAEKVSQLTENANNMSVKGTELAAQAERGMVSITNSSNEVDKIIVDIKVEMDKIGKIVGLISDLANQTNLLALNAAIEAARAGEAGRGFAVVATEVKSLAQESRASAENIADMIGTLQKKSMAAGEAVASSNREVKSGSEALSQTLRSFNDIVRSIEDISKNVVEVASLSEEQAATVQEVTASVNEVQQMVHGTAKDAMDAAAAAEEASASIDQITKVVGSVNHIVDSVSKEMSKFKI
ncbi:MAG: methyl-accepting chemotaxis protein [Methanoregulaceae archaeon]|jgi:methyl-accepting chemotaxis protein|nr:methyl-accepting chemotaxis protein [Methanoregulaceae archaeon]